MKKQDYTLVEKTVNIGATSYKVTIGDGGMEHVTMVYGTERTEVRIGWVESENKRGWKLTFAYLCHRSVDIFLPRGHYKKIIVDNIDE